MGTSDIIALVLIAVVGLAAIVYFVIKSNGKRARVRSILKNHPSLVLALLNREELPSLEALSEVQSETILSLTDNDWDEWEALKVRVLNIAQQYPYTLHEFINEHFPENKERIIYKKKVALFTPIPQKVKHALNSLLLDELRKIDSDSESTWKQRDELQLSVSKIKQKFPEGYKSYCTIHKSATPLNSEIVSHQKQIAELQKLYDDSKGYEGWEKKQEDFCSKFWQILKDVRSNDGRYSYNVSFQKPNRKGSLIESNFKVWQGFCESFSSCLLDKQTQSYLQRFKQIENLKSRSWHFCNHVYEQIFDIINRFKEIIEGDLYVFFVDRSSFNWSKRTYIYHYSHLRDLINESDIYQYDLSDLPLVKDNGNVGGIFIFDFITANEDLKNNCKFIMEHFRKSVPLLGYYSMEKEHDEKELLELANKHEGYLDSEEKDVEFIKNCLLQVRKHSFFSYIAIPNTWIGEAGGAKETKSIWLDNPSKYEFKTKDKEGCIAGEYSIDGGETFEDISIMGDGFDIDDTAQFTYELFKKMGVLYQFKKNVHKAIEHINQKEILAHH